MTSIQFDLWSWKLFHQGNYEGIVAILQYIITVLPREIITVFLFKYGRDLFSNVGIPKLGLNQYKTIASRMSHDIAMVMYCILIVMVTAWRHDVVDYGVKAVTVKSAVALCIFHAVERLKSCFDFVRIILLNVLALRGE